MSFRRTIHHIVSWRQRVESLPCVEHRKKTQRSIEVLDRVTMLDALDDAIGGYLHVFLHEELPVKA
jgi:hypothetical protein